ncbi:MAG TPA: HlyD family efflux transporter periplasmic adaptor subunit [Candidatus Sulfotelmatobacter sp.]|jgi:multidrug efflux pump subunit AcrA (membrane-fusion protein)|nr:HlyD family efflux transporter periplasmic adaptor subunit [Candidatus Sulfotelmatobacter sp.]
MSSQLTQRGSIDVESEMSPQEPPPWIIRSAAWVLMGGFLLALLVAIVVRLPETVHCPFILIPATGADPIQSPRQAIISRVAVGEGQPVKAGEDLFILRSDEIRGWDTQFRTLTEELRNKVESLTQYETAYVSQLEIKKAEIEQAKSEVKFRENHAATSRDLVTRMEKLAKLGGESEIDLVKLKLDLAGSEKDLSVAQRTVQQTNLDRERIETEHARQQGEQRSEIEKLKMRIGALKIDLENTQQNLLTVRSPYEGVITSMDQRTVGSFVQQGQVLCQLARKDAKPRARMTLNEAGLPKLAIALRVRYFFEAFPYQRYGAVTGKLDWISPSAVGSGDGSHFVALGSLDRDVISSRPGQSLPLRVGMRGDAHIIVGGRTLIEYAFEPIRQLRESMKQ